MLVHGPGVPWYVMLAKDRYKYVRTLIEGEVEELYDLDADPAEVTNLAFNKEHFATVQRFRNAAIDELKRTDAGMVQKLPQVRPLISLTTSRRNHE